MSLRHRCWYAALFMAVLTLSACSSTGNIATQTAAETPSPSTDKQTASEQSQSAMEALYWARRDSAKMRFVPAEVDFMAGMIGHHAQALVMSALVPTNATSSSVKTLAARIINAQEGEIAIMQKWLRDRNQPVPEVHIDGLNLMIHGGGDHDHLHMPGMLSQEQLDELAAAQGTAFDRLFLTYMIQHHGGAITMVDDLFAHDGVGQDEAAFKLASDINVDQITEIARMKRMLSMLPE